MTEEQTISGSVGLPGAEQAATDVVARAVDLTKVYGESEAQVRALDGVSVDFARGRFTAIMGPSGSGKSTLMHCMAALDRPTTGTGRHRRRRRQRAQRQGADPRCAATASASSSRRSTWCRR